MSAGKTQYVSTCSAAAWKWRLWQNAAVIWFFLFHNLTHCGPVCQWPFSVCFCGCSGNVRERKTQTVNSFTESGVFYWKTFWLDISCNFSAVKKPRRRVHYRLLQDMMIVCLFRLKYVFLGWDNTFKLQTLCVSPGGGQGSTSSCMHSKKDIESFFWLLLWEHRYQWG